MKLAALLIVPAVLFAAAGIELPPGSHAIHPETPASAQQDSGSFTSSAVLIEPGVSVGSLKLGDTRERVQELFQEIRRPGVGKSLRHNLQLGRHRKQNSRGQSVHPVQERKNLSDRFRDHALSYRRGHRSAGFAGKSCQCLSRFEGLHAAHRAGCGAGRPSADFLGRQEEGNRFHVRLLPRATQAISLPDHRVRARQNLLPARRNNRFSDVAGDSPVLAGASRCDGSELKSKLECPDVLQCGIIAKADLLATGN
jgi:hypothetical protein